MSLKILRLLARLLLRLVADVEMVGMENVPRSGGCVAVSNHIGRLDAVLALILPERDDIIMMIAEKYQAYAFWRFWARRFDAIWLNRFEADFHALREVVKRLKGGGILAIAPEGTRSKAGTLLEGKPGAAFLAAKAQVPVLPLAIMGTEDAVVRASLKRLRRIKVKIVVGEPFMLPPIERKNKDAYLQAQTDEMMCRIGALLPPRYHGVYAAHPRLQDLASFSLSTDS
ncbi:MAG: 1-acyl-sn-glycerol-3-phosphate acyltransferase [Ardenticatenaceae bacterium]|nr:1-acyl-sn-glycerol-3-phosphate acyltransferase [Ardenticatenaceae bacterium]